MVQSGGEALKVSERAAQRARKGIMGDTKEWKQGFNRHVEYLRAEGHQYDDEWRCAYCKQILKIEGVISFNHDYNVINGDSMYCRNDDCKILAGLAL